MLKLKPKDIYKSLYYEFSGLQMDDKEKLKLWKDFHEESNFDKKMMKLAEIEARLSLIKTFYSVDDIFRREIDGLKNKSGKKKIKAGDIEKTIDEYLEEAKYRAYMASFDNMKKNFEARKKEMTKIKEAFSGKAN